MGKSKKERKDTSTRVEAGAQGTVMFPFPHCFFCLKSRSRARFMMVGAMGNICSDCLTVGFGELSQRIQQEVAVKTRQDAEKEKADQDAGPEVGGASSVKLPFRPQNKK